MHPVPANDGHPCKARGVGRRGGNLVGGGERVNMREGFSHGVNNLARP